MGVCLTGKRLIPGAFRAVGPKVNPVAEPVVVLDGGFQPVLTGENLFTGGRIAAVISNDVSEGVSGAAHL